MNDRPIPHSDDIEKCVIGCFLNDTSLSDKVLELEEEDFHNKDLRRCAKAIRMTVRDGLDIDLVTVSQKLTNVDMFLMDCMDKVATTATFSTWFKQLKTLSAQRQAIRSSYNFYQSIHEATDPIDMISDYGMELTSLADKYAISDLKQKSLVKESFSSGLFGYDYNVGGFFGSQRIILKGAKNQGKTTLAKQIGYSCGYNGKKVLYFSGEQDKELEECDLALMGATPDEIQHRKGIAGRNEYYPTESAFRKYKDSVGKNIKVIDRIGAGKQDMFNYVFSQMEKCAKDGYKLFILDNMAVLNNPKGNKNQFVHQAEIINKIDEFKIKYDVDVILIVHPKKGKGFESTSGIGQIENLADTVIRFIRITENKHIVDTENYMLKSNALSGCTLSDEVKQNITAILTFEKVKKGTKFPIYFTWDESKGVSMEVTNILNALDYQKEGSWTKHYHKHDDYRGNEALNGNTKDIQ